MNLSVTYMISLEYKPDVRNKLMNSSPIWGHGLQLILDSLNTWSIDRYNTQKEMKGIGIGIFVITI